MSSESDRVLRIIAVEDDNHIGRIIQLAMPALGIPYEFVIVLSAEECLELWNRQPFDLLLADYNLRGMSGLKLISTLKEQGFDVPMLLITAYDTQQLARQARELGVSAYIPKPFFVDELIDTIRTLLPARTRTVNDEA